MRTTPPLLSKMFFLLTLLPALVVFGGYVVKPFFPHRMVLDSRGGNQLTTDLFLKEMKQRAVFCEYEEIYKGKQMTTGLVVGRWLEFLAWVETQHGADARADVPSVKLTIWSRTNHWFPAFQPKDGSAAPASAGGIQPHKKSVYVLKKTSNFVGDQSMKLERISLWESNPTTTQMEVMASLAQQLATSRQQTTSAVIWGETGTGKTELAQYFLPFALRALVVRWRPTTLGAPSLDDMLEEAEHHKQKLGLEKILILLDEFDKPLQDIHKDTIRSKNLWVNIPVADKTSWTETVDTLMRRPNVVVLVLMNSNPAKIDRLDGALLGAGRFPGGRFQLELPSLPEEKQSQKITTSQEVEIRPIKRMTRRRPRGGAPESIA
jgi:hypothetical protein